MAYVRLHAVAALWCFCDGVTVSAVLFSRYYIFVRDTSLLVPLTNENALSEWRLGLETMSLPDARCQFEGQSELDVRSGYLPQFWFPPSISFAYNVAAIP